MNFTYNFLSLLLYYLEFKNKIQENALFMIYKTCKITDKDNCMSISNQTEKYQVKVTAWVQSPSTVTKYSVI